MQGKAVLILGAGRDQLFMIRTAKEMGLLTVAVDGNPSAPGLSEADYAEPINFSHIGEVKAYVRCLLDKGIPLSGVCTMGSDIPNLLAEVAEEFGWSGPSRETGYLTTDKFAMKECLRKAGIPVPDYCIVQRKEDVLRQWKEWGAQKVVLKPTDRAGSRGVSILASTDEIADAWKNAADNSLNGRILLERYIEGPQISTESILYDDFSATPGFADRVYEDMEVFWPQVMENGGWVPSRENADVQKKISELVERAARALGISRGPAKGDVVLSEQGPMIIEIAARLSGGDFCESLVPLGTGVNYVKEVLRIATGEKPDPAALRPRWNKAVANRYFFLPPGRLDGIRGVGEAQAQDYIHKFELYYKKGEIIPPIQNHGQRVGVFVLVADDRIQAQAKVDYIYNQVEFKMDGSWRKGFLKR